MGSKSRERMDFLISYKPLAGALKMRAGGLPCHSAMIGLLQQKHEHPQAGNPLTLSLLSLFRPGVIMLTCL